MHNSKAEDVKEFKFTTVGSQEWDCTPDHESHPEAAVAKLSEAKRSPKRNSNIRSVLNSTPFHATSKDGESSCDGAGNLTMSTMINHQAIPSSFSNIFVQNNEVTSSQLSPVSFYQDKAAVFSEQLASKRSSPLKQFTTSQKKEKQSQDFYYDAY